MAVDYARTAREVIEGVGGAGNIQTVTHCMTRLRFALKDPSKADKEAVNAVDGVLGAVEAGGQFQAIIGNNVVTCYDEVLALLGDGKGAGSVDQGETGAEGGSEGSKAFSWRRFTFKSWGTAVLDAVSGCIAPTIPVLLGCGMVKILVILLDMFGVSSDLPTYKILTIIGAAGYYFLPMLVAWSASKKFQCSSVLALTIVGVLLHPDLVDLLSKGSSSFLGLPVTEASYGSTVIPAILCTWFLSKVEPLADKVFRGWTHTLLKPTAIFLVVVPICLIAIAPLGMVIGNGMAAVLNFCYSKAGWLTVAVYAALLPFVVMVGMHVAVFPYIFSNLETLGFDVLQLPAMLAYNFSMAAAAAAVAIRTKNADLRATALAAAVSAAAGGISEPALYGVCLNLRRPLYASMIGSGIAGLFIGIVGVKAFAFSGPCLLSLPMFGSTHYASNFVFALIGMVVSIVVTFVATLLLGWDDPEVVEA